MIDAIGSAGAAGFAGHPPPARELTDEQKAKVQEILADYDLDDLSEEDMREIGERLQAAEIPPGPGLKAEFEAAGFTPPPPPESPPKASAGKIDLSTLGAEDFEVIGKILEGYDLKNMSEADKQNLRADLQAAGFSEDRPLINMAG